MKRKSAKRNRTTSKRTAQRRRSITITIPLPRADELLTIALLAIGVSGITYSLVPLAFSPRSSDVSMQASAAQTPQPEKPAHLGRSVPTRLIVSDIGIDTALIKLGKNADGTLAAPDRYDIAGWYRYSPTPGEIGPAIIVGHVDNYLGPAIFFRLSELKSGQVVEVVRQDDSKAKFRVDKVELFDQQNFPTKAVYGNLDYPGLRLITCGGVYNPLTGRYSHNTVVYATYESP